MTGTSRYTRQLGNVENALPSTPQSMSCHPQDHVANAVQNHDAGPGWGRAVSIVSTSRARRASLRPLSIPLKPDLQAPFNPYPRPGASKVGTGGEQCFFRKTRSDFLGHLIA